MSEEWTPAEIRRTLLRIDEGQKEILSKISGLNDIFITKSEGALQQEANVNIHREMLNRIVALEQKANASFSKTTQIASLLFAGLAVLISIWRI